MHWMCKDLELHPNTEEIPKCKVIYWNFFFSCFFYFITLQFDYLEIAALIIWTN